MIETECQSLDALRVMKSILATSQDYHMVRFALEVIIQIRVRVILK